MQDRRAEAELERRWSATEKPDYLSLKIAEILPMKFKELHKHYDDHNKLPAGFWHFAPTIV